MPRRVETRRWITRGTNVSRSRYNDERAAGYYDRRDRRLRTPPACAHFARPVLKKRRRWQHVARAQISRANQFLRRRRAPRASEQKTSFFLETKKKRDPPPLFASSFSRSGEQGRADGGHGHCERHVLRLAAGPAQRPPAVPMSNST